ncbi:MAG: hypothetical protein ACQEQG_09510 [Bacillota bacterium]
MGIFRDLLNLENNDLMQNNNRDKFRDEHINKSLQESRDYLSLM